MNLHGFLTINSQPRVNGAPSTDPIFGWGGRDGYVFQKAYVEFFCSPTLINALLKAFASYPALTFHAMNLDGQEYTNAEGMATTLAHTVTAATTSTSLAQALASPSPTQGSSSSPADVAQSSQNSSGTSSAARARPNAVTWGVFPGREIIQPTVVDPVSFRAWKDEAFELWATQWRDMYADQSCSTSGAEGAADPVNDDTHVRTTQLWAQSLPKDVYSL